jgi:hypothetical protein
MKIRDLDIAIAEAERFLSAAKDLRKEESPKPYAGGYISGSKLTGYVRRASMDLTRSLATLRGRGA